nr:hypothetical protein [Streptomyces tsukubensis NRRL18488]
MSTQDQGPETVLTDGAGAGPAVPALVGVIGGGRMGAGIAQSFAAAGSAV